MNKKRSFFISSLVMMMFITSSGVFLNGIQQRNTSLNGIQKTYPKSSGPHSKIYIDGNNALNAYCAGNGTDGTFSNPHIFKDYEIDAGYSGSGIEIRNTDLYLIIQNCSIINSGALNGGIKLYNCKNINITDCHINDNFYGVYLENSENNMLSRNNVSNNGNNGIHLDDSHNNTLSYNKVFDNSHYGIFLTGSDSNTIYQNDAIHNLYYNIYLYISSDSNVLTENNASLSIFDSGFFLLDSNYNMLTNNFATSNNFNGIQIQNSNNSKLTRNTASFNADQGIQLWSSYNNILTENVAYNNTQNGLNLYHSDNTTLLGNDAHNNFQNGIYFFFSDNCTILDNDIKENQQDGLNLYQSDNHIISGNIISDNVNRGVFLDDDNSGSDYNTFYNNFFVNNGIHAIDETSNNDWNNAVIGNYWDNYTGVDDDNDGIGDSPHIFNGGTDYLPIWDDTSPIITIITPIYNTTVGRTALDFTIEIYDPYLDKMWYTIDGGINNVIFTGNGTIDQTLWETLWDDLSDGDLITIRFSANDTFGHLTYKEVVVIKSDPSQPTPGGIPGYDLFLFISVLFISIGIISIIAIKKRVNI